MSTITSITVGSGFALATATAREAQPEPRWSALRTDYLRRLAEYEVSFEMLAFLPSSLRFAAEQSAIALAAQAARECDLQFSAVPDCARISLLGAGIGVTAGVFYRALAGLREREIPLLHFSHSGVTISLLVSGEHASEAETFLRGMLRDHRVPAAPFSFDLALARIRVNGEDRQLGARQAELLQFLMDNVGRVIEAEEAARHLFGTDGKSEVAALRVHMHNLRKKVEQDPEHPRYIVTVRNQGYVFVR